MTEYAQWIGIMVSAISGFLSFLDKKIIKHLRSKGATNSQTAIDLIDLNFLFRLRLKSIKNSGIVKINYTEKYYFDEALHKTKRKIRRIRGMIILLILAIIISIVILNKR